MNTITENEKKLLTINLKNCICMFKENRKLKDVIEQKDRDIKILNDIIYE